MTELETLEFLDHVNAVPAGLGHGRYRNYRFWGMTFIFREVERSARAA